MATSEPVNGLFSRRTILNVSILVASIAIFVASVPSELVRGMLFPRCEDFHTACTTWESQGECDNNPDYMSIVCRKACRACDTAVPTTTSREMAASSTSPNITYDVPITATSSSSQQQMDEDEDDQMEETEEDSYSEGEEEEAGHDLVEPNLCINLDEDCDALAEKGECESNPDWMLQKCRPACKACPECSDRHESCSFWADIGECEKNPYYMLDSCARSCKVCSTSTEDTSQNNAVEEEEERIRCQDKRPAQFCMESKKRGDCETNPGWMIVFCGKTCGKCDLMSASARCRPETFNDPSYTNEPALQAPGDVTKLFKKVLAEYPQSEIVLQPDDGPWLIKLPNFVSDAEREALLSQTLPQVKRSTDQGEFNEEGVQEQVVSSGRTSSNAWCMHECMADPLVISLTERISRLVGISEKNFESYQILQYKESQKYDVHHDSSEADIETMSGPRILTFFIYLSDVEEGGETFFDKLGIKVKPQKGMAVLWPSVLDQDPTKIDWRTTHAALPVIKGVKLAANIWIHLRDFKTPNHWGCTGAFD